MIRLSQISFLLFPDTAKFSKFQREEYARLWFDLSKLAVASLILKFFEPGSPQLDIYSILTLIIGLTGFLLCVRIGLNVAKGL